MEKRVSARLPEALVVRLEAYASEQDRSVSSVVRIALEQLLSSGSNPEPLRHPNPTSEAAVKAMMVGPPMEPPISPVEAVAGVKPREVAKKLAAQVPGVALGRPGVDPKVCEHPKAQRQVKSWGTICGACGKRL